MDSDANPLSFLNLDIFRIFSIFFLCILHFRILDNIRRHFKWEGVVWPYTILARTYLCTASTLQCLQTLDPFTDMYTNMDLCLAHPLESWTPFDIVVNSAYALLTMPVTYEPTNIIEFPIYKVIRHQHLKNSTIFLGPTYFLWNRICKFRFRKHSSMDVVFQSIRF